MQAYQLESAQSNFVAKAENKQRKAPDKATLFVCVVRSPMSSYPYVIFRVEYVLNKILKSLTSSVCQTSVHSEWLHDRYQSLTRSIKRKYGLIRSVVWQQICQYLSSKYLPWTLFSVSLSMSTFGDRFLNGDNSFWLQLNQRDLRNSWCWQL